MIEKLLKYNFLKPYRIFENQNNEWYNLDIKYVKIIVEYLIKFLDVSDKEELYKNIDEIISINENKKEEMAIELEFKKMEIKKMELENRKIELEINIKDNNIRQDDKTIDIEPDIIENKTIDIEPNIKDNKTIDIEPNINNIDIESDINNIEKFIDEYININYVYQYGNNMEKLKEFVPEFIQWYNSNNSEKFPFFQNAINGNNYGTNKETKEIIKNILIDKNLINRTNNLKNLRKLKCNNYEYIFCDKKLYEDIINEHFIKDGKITKILNVYEFFEKKLIKLLQSNKSLQSNDFLITKNIKCGNIRSKHPEKNDHFKGYPKDFIKDIENILKEHSFIKIKNIKEISYDLSIL